MKRPIGALFAEWEAKLSVCRYLHIIPDRIYRLISASRDEFCTEHLMKIQKRGKASEQKFQSLQTFSNRKFLLMAKSSEIGDAGYCQLDAAN